jgi:hypothetical protein
MINTNLWTEFLLQFRKQHGDLAILLASNRPPQQRLDKETKKNKKGKDCGKTNNTKRFVKCTTLRTKQPTHLESSLIDYLKVWNVKTHKIILFLLNIPLVWFISKL